MKLLRVVVCTLALCGATAPAFAASIGIGASIAVSANTIAVPIEITGALDLSSWQLDLIYDPTDVQVNTACDPFSGDIYCDFLTGPITEGPFFGSLSPFNTFSPGFITLNAITLQQAGLVLGMGSIFGGTAPGPSGSGTLAFVEFQVVGNGTSPIRVTNTAFTTFTPVPEPATMTLMIGGVATAFARRARQKRRNTSGR